MSNLPPSHQFASATVAQGRTINSADHELIIRQKPMHAKVFIGKEKDRKPIDPPPIVQLKISEAIDPPQTFLQSPYYFISASLVDDEDTQPPADREEVKSALAGTLVSSLHRLKDTDNRDGAFFVFGDLSVKLEGLFKIQFTLYEVRDKEVEYINSITSEPFQVYPAKNWPGMGESTFLTRSFSDQGVRLRLRKEPRFRLGTKGPASDDYQPRHYNTSRRRQSQLESVASQGTSQVSMSPLSQANVGETPRPTKIEQVGPNLAPAPSPSVESAYAPDTRKRGFSQSSQPGLYGGPSAEPSPKRLRQEVEETQQQPYSGQEQYVPQPQMVSYGARHYADPYQGIYPQPPQQQPQQSYQSFSPNYMASPQPRLNREQGYFSPRRGESFQSSPPYPSAGARLPAQYQRSPAQMPYQYNQPLQPSPFHPSYGIQPQHQYSPQLMQPVPSRPPSNLGMYSQPEPQIDPLLASKTMGGPGEMQPPPFYSRNTPGIQSMGPGQPMGPGQQIGSANPIYMGQRMENMQGGDIEGYRPFDSLGGEANAGEAGEEEIPPRPR